KAADNLDVDVELKELATRGSVFAESEQTRDTRRLIRNEKLYTQSAKDMWDAIQESDPDSWHAKSNKWYRLAHAGKYTGVRLKLHPSVISWERKTLRPVLGVWSVDHY